VVVVWHGRGERGAKGPSADEMPGPLLNHNPALSLEVPSERYNINADGNCLFRALSYVITGTQSFAVKLFNI
jgi:hypothetical protein